MSNKELYKRTFSQIHASEDKVKEIIQMKDTKKHRRIIGKRILIIAACVGCALSAMMVVNASTDGAISKAAQSIFITVDGEKKELDANVYYDKDGNKVTEAELDESKIQIKEKKDNKYVDFSFEVEGDTITILENK